MTVAYIVMTSPRPPTFTSNLTVHLPLSSRLRAIFLGCYLVVGLAALAFLVVR